MNSKNTSEKYNNISYSYSYKLLLSVTDKTAVITAIMKLLLLRYVTYLFKETGGIQTGLLLFIRL